MIIWGKRREKREIRERKKEEDAGRRKKKSRGWVEPVAGRGWKRREEMPWVQCGFALWVPHRGWPTLQTHDRPEFGQPKSGWPPRPMAPTTLFFYFLFLWVLLRWVWFFDFFLMDLTLDLVVWFFSLVFHMTLAIFRVIKSQKELTFLPWFLVLKPKLSFETFETSYVAL